LKKIAEHSIWTVAQLQRQIAYDRLLERLFQLDPRWVVKGAAALLARNLGSRATLDIDLYRESSPDESEAALRRAAAHDLGDWFRFEILSRTSSADAGVGRRLAVVAYVGATEWAAFHVDLVGADLRMTGDPEDVPPLAIVAIPQIVQHGYRAYPLVDHVADKVAAMFELHGENQRPSTRYKDLVDLISIVRGASIGAAEQMHAITSEAKRRGIILPRSFHVPDREVWRRGYAAEVKGLPNDLPQTLDEALNAVSPFIDPLLDGSARGRWESRVQRWIDD
jgi:hypothetical protein